MKSMISTRLYRQRASRRVPYETGVVRYREIARGQILGDESGLVKLLFHRENRRLLGVRAIGTGATELIHMHTVFPTWSLLLVMLVGCATPGLNTKQLPSETGSKPSLSPKELTNRLDYWREEAMELHDMARRRAREADVLLKNQEGALVEELVTRMRTLAKQLDAAAEYADEQAQETQRQVPQGMTQ